MRKLGVGEWLVVAVMSMYTGAKKLVRTVYGNSSGFEVKKWHAPRISIEPTVITFRVSCRRREMYCGDARLCLCLSVCPRLHAHAIALTQM